MYNFEIKLNNLSPDHASVIIQKQDYPLKKLLWKHDLTLKARHEDFEVPSLKYSMTKLLEHTEA